MTRRALLTWLVSVAFPHKSPPNVAIPVSKYHEKWVGKDGWTWYIHLQGRCEPWGVRWVAESAHGVVKLHIHIPPHYSPRRTALECDAALIALKRRLSGWEYVHE